MDFLNHREEGVGFYQVFSGIIVGVLRLEASVWIS